MVDVYSGEAERRAALEEVTRLRREYDTTTAKGAKAFANSPEAQAALARLDAAKSAVGMRTRAEDLAALNKYASADTGTLVQGNKAVTAKPTTRAERAANKQLNAPSKQYFKQVKEAYTNPDIVPTWKPRMQVTQDLIQQYAQGGVDASRARYDWVWTEDPKTGEGRWGISLIGVIKQKPADLARANQLDIFYSDSAPIAQAKKEPSWGTTWNSINLDELEQAIPDITFSELQELYYRLTLERDTDITIEDILDKYDELYGEG